MNKRNVPIKTIILTSIILALGCSALLPKMHALTPPPDGCYPNFTTAEGCRALSHLTDGAGNTGLGGFALFGTSIGNFNTGVGAGTLVLNNADSNTAVGAAALLLNTSGTGNVALGTQALLHNDTGNYNNAVGFMALFNNIDGINNNAFGSGALLNHQTGGSNNAVGFFALNADQSGFFNNAVGDGALANNISGSHNTAVGDLALDSSTGDFNTALGANAGTDPGILSNNVYIGDPGFAGDHNVISIGGIAASGTPYDNCFIGGIATQSQVTDGVTVCEVTVRLEDGLLGIDCTHPSNPGSAPDSAPLRRSRPQQPHARPAMPNRTIGQVEKLEETVAEQQKQIETLTSQLKEQAAQFTAKLKEQAAQIQKVSAQLELRKPVQRVVANKQ